MTVSSTRVKALPADDIARAVRCIIAGGILVTASSQAFADSDGTFINQEGRVQRYFKAIFSAGDPPPRGPLAHLERYLNARFGLAGRGLEAATR